MFESLFFVFLFLTVLLLPGVAVLNLSRGRKLVNQTIDLGFSYLFCFTISYGTFAITTVVAKFYGLSLTQFSFLITSYLSLSFAALVLSFFLQKRGEINQRLMKLIHQTWPLFLIWTVLSIYHFLVGAYTEIPADIYFHIEKFRQNYQLFANDSMKPLGSLKSVVTQDAEIWYNLLAWLMITAQASSDQMIQLSTWLSQGLFLTASYYLSKTIFKGKKDSVIISILAIVLLFVHFGVSAFSFVRYYALAPAILAFICYFLAVIVCWNVLISRTFKGLFSQGVLVIVALIAAMLIHTQEAMFIVIHLSVMILIYSFLKVGQGQASTVKGTIDLPSTHSLQSSLITQAEQIKFSRFILVIAIFISVVFFAAYFYVHLNLVHFGNYGNRLVEFGPSFGILPRLSILNPMYQFIQVVSLWGLVVYALFFFHWRRYRHNLIIMSGMLLPFLTVFNPLFTDLFLRLTDSTVLWRFCFLIPLYYVAADLIIDYLRSFLTASGKRSSVAKATAKLVVLAMLAILLLPFKNGWNNLHYSRYPTLKSVEHSQSYQHLDDVISFLNQYPERKDLLTDPVTGYILSGFTPHINYRDKFFVTPYSGFKKFTFENYDSFPLSQYSGNFLVINQRTIENGNSFVGAVTRHWPANLFQRISPFYPNQLIQHVQSYPDKFELVFNQDNVLIYQLN